MKGWSFAIKIAIIVFVLFGIVTAVGVNIKVKDMEEQVNVVTKQRDKLREELDAELDEIGRPKDEEYVKRIAREELNYFMPGEIVFYNDIAG